MSLAIFSICNSYRYALERELKGDGPPCLFIMLNPSTADATIDDPTIRRCISFANREKYSRLTVLNLYALRATDPRELITHIDPIGPENDRFLEVNILAYKAKGWPVVAAWGAFPFAFSRGTELIKKFGPFKCLGVTATGMPKHPLYLKSNTIFKSLKFEDLHLGASK